ncbi:hypothetical protein AcW1_004077 [Taiwanofungus camphoratus]|nr:hypothetical protein AcV5_000457 [Antrodia cinnamomea]KAI0951801.1 hypothetical protein AcV7_007798 [Antrodia cinnamomea]KAI0959172.1 hypothetical protein AcW1_004077 [Antrodia cinnamomea]
MPLSGLFEPCLFVDVTQSCTGSFNVPCEAGSALSVVCPPDLQTPPSVPTVPLLFVDPVFYNVYRIVHSVVSALHFCAYQERHGLRITNCCPQRSLTSVLAWLLLRTFSAKITPHETMHGASLCPRIVIRKSTPARNH